MRWRQCGCGCGCGCGCRRCCPRLVAGISTRTFSSGLSSSSKLAKLESEDKLLSDAELWLEEFESDLGRHPLSQLRLTPVAKRRRATPNHFLIPIFPAFQSAMTQVGQCRVGFEDPAGLVLVQEGLVLGGVRLWSWP